MVKVSVEKENVDKQFLMKILKSDLNRIAFFLIVLSYQVPYIDSV